MPDETNPPSETDDALAVALLTQNMQRIEQHREDCQRDFLVLRNAMMQGIEGRIEPEHQLTPSPEIL